MRTLISKCPAGCVEVFAIALLLMQGATASAAEAAQSFEGTWMRANMRNASDFLLGVDLPYKPETQNIAADRLQWFKDGKAAASAHLTCRPTGVQGVTATKEAMLILQTMEKMVMIFQEDREVRHIHMNRSHPKNLTPSYSGHSVGRWEGDTLVIDTVGFNGRGQLDEVGNPHSDQLQVVERWTQSADRNTLTVQFTFADPVYYTKPFTKTREYRRAPGRRVADYDCAENPRSDDFETMTFENDWFRPTCVRPVNNGMASDKVVCETQPSSARP